MNWKDLQAELSASAYLEPTDDLTTQRGLVATAAAILERMSNETREVSWRPYRLIVKTADEPVPSSPTLTSDKPGNAPVRSVPQPRAPQPGGEAVSPGALLGTYIRNTRDAFALED